MRFAIPQVRSERRSDGATILRCQQALGECERAVGDWLVRWAERAPQRRFLAECAGEGWRAITYDEALATLRPLLDRTWGRRWQPGARRTSKSYTLADPAQSWCEGSPRRGSATYAGLSRQPRAGASAHSSFTDWCPEFRDYRC